MTTEVKNLYDQIIKGGGIFGQSAELYLHEPEEVHRDFLLQFKLQLNRHREDLIAMYGETFVNDLEKFQ